jgi:LuxR family maltose regulon positive regulatory protein
MAQAFKRLGSDEVTVVEPLDRLLAMDEPFAGDEARARGRTPRGVPRSPELTDRERAVLRLLPGSLRRDEMAVALHVSVNTVKTQLGSVYAELGVSSRADAVTRARQLGLL